MLRIALCLCLRSGLRPMDQNSDNNKTTARDWRIAQLRKAITDKPEIFNETYFKSVNDRMSEEIKLSKAAFYLGLSLFIMLVSVVVLGVDVQIGLIKIGTNPYFRDVLILMLAILNFFGCFTSRNWVYLEDIAAAHADNIGANRLEKDMLRFASPMFIGFGFTFFLDVNPFSRLSKTKLNVFMCFYILLAIALFVVLIAGMAAYIFILADLIFAPRSG